MIWFIIWLAGFLLWTGIQLFGWIVLEKRDPKLKLELRYGIIDGLVWPYLAFCALPLIPGVIIVLVWDGVKKLKRVN